MGRSVWCNILVRSIHSEVLLLITTNMFPCLTFKQHLTLISSISAWLCQCFAHAYTVDFSGNIAFPVQHMEPIDTLSFTRTYNTAIKVFRCPTGFFFNTEKLKCVAKINNNIKKNNRHPFKTSNAVCPPNFKGTLPNPLNCRSYYDCWEGRGYVMPCNEHLLYSEKVFRCEWPESAGCCEYLEKNSSLIVQPSWNKNR